VNTFPFIPFWLRCFKAAGKRAWRAFGELRALAAVGTFLSISLTTYGLFTRQAAQISYWLVATPVAFAACFFVYFFVKAPHEIYREACIMAESEREAMKIELQTRNDSMRNALLEKQVLLENEIAASNSARQVLQAELTRLKENNRQRQEMRDAIGTALSKLRARIAAVNSLRQKNPLPHLRRAADDETLLLVDQVYEIVKASCGVADAEAFRVLHGRPNSDAPIGLLENNIAFVQAHIEALKQLLDKMQ
jgi:hypothetical protein